MDRSIPLALSVFLLSACAHQAPAVEASGRVEIHVEFKDSGKADRAYDILADVFSNDLSAIKKAQIFIDGNHAWDLKLKTENTRVFIDERIPFVLPIGKTILRFDLGSQGTRDVELVCTRVGKCL